MTTHYIQPDLSWATTLPGLPEGDSNALATDIAGNTYIVTHFRDSSITAGGSSFNNQGATDIILYKRSPSGEMVWVRALGGDGDDYAVAITTGYDGFGIGVYVFGTTSSSSMALVPLTLSLPSEQPGPVSFIVKLDGSTGNAQWAKSIQGEGQVPTGVAVPAGGVTVWLVGYFSGSSVTVGEGEDELVLSNHNQEQSAPSTDGFLIQLSQASGGVVLGEALGGAGDDAVHQAVAKGAGSGVYLAGYSSASSFTYGSQEVALSADQGYIMKFASVYESHRLKWVVGVEGTSAITGMTVDNDGNVIVVGSMGDHLSLTGPIPQTITNPNPGGAQTGYVAKLSAAGEVVWISVVGQVDVPSPPGALPLAVVTDSCGRIIIGGLVSAAPITIGTTPIASMAGGSSDAFLARLTPSGNISDVLDLGGPGNDSIWALGMDQEDNLVLLGDFGGSMSSRARGEDMTPSPAGSITVVSLVSTYTGLL